MIMIDIETLGLRPGAPIPSIGYCIFDWDGIKDHGTIAINIDNWVNAKPEISTVKFWLQCAPEAIAKTFFRPDEELLTWVEALLALKNTVTVSQIYGEGVWANGPLFDLAHLEYWYEQMYERAPWSHRLPRDCRTLFEVAMSFADWDRSAASEALKEQHGEHLTHHDAESDAVLQALLVIDAHRALHNRIPAAPVSAQQDNELHDDA